MSNQSFFHRIRDGLTLNLASIESVSDNTAHLVWFKGEHPDSFLGHRELETGQTFVVRMCGAQSAKKGLGELGDRHSITEQEASALQDALDWYNTELALKQAS
jgi:hypothetical protein